MHEISMVRKPTFCIVLGDADNWSVEAEWPDGTIERVISFKRKRCADPTFRIDSGSVSLRFGLDR